MSGPPCIDLRLLGRNSELRDYSCVPVLEELTPRSDFAESGGQQSSNHDQAVERAPSSGPLMNSARLSITEHPSVVTESGSGKAVNIGVFVDADNPSDWVLQSNDAIARNIGASAPNPDDQAGWFEQNDLEVTNIGSYADPDDPHFAQDLVETEPRNIGTLIEFEQTSTGAQFQDFESFNIGGRVDPPK